MKFKTIISMAAAAMALVSISVPSHASKLDNRIESSVRQTYIFKVYLKDDDIKIKSTDGVVELTGVVADDLNRSLARETVAGLPDVKGVDNRLEVKGAAPTANSDAWLHDKVKSTLKFHRRVNGDTTAVEVRDGVVTLRGDADNQAQKELTTEYAKDVEGVKDVQNEMTVARNPKKMNTVKEDIDDASITAQVKLTLLYHRSTSAISTSVTTKKGMVTLYGKAKNAAALKLATELANDVKGVKDVKNRMVIE
jgi:osmotically-inducible protein OsmY